jgi:nucleotide-binding universal stress UspA family protein
MMESALKIEDRIPTESLLPETVQTAEGTQKFRRILVPVELRNDCRVSIRYAIQLAETFGSTLNLLHLYEEPYVISHNPRSRNCDLFKHQRQKVFADFYNLLNETRNQFPQSAGYFEYGNPDHDICRIAGQLGADLLILCAHHNRSLDYQAIGRRAQRILANAPCPVLIVHEPSKANPTDEISGSLKR